MCLCFFNYSHFLLSLAHLHLPKHLRLNCCSSNAMTDVDVIDVTAMKKDESLMEQQAAAFVFFQKKQMKSAISQRTAKYCAELSKRYASRDATPKPSPKPSSTKASPKPSSTKPSSPKSSPHKPSPRKKSIVIEVFDSSDEDDDRNYNFSVRKRKVSKRSATSAATQSPPQLPRSRPATVTLVEYIKDLQRKHLYTDVPIDDCHFNTRGLSLDQLLRQRRALVQRLIRLEDVIWGLRADIWGRACCFVDCTHVLTNLSHNTYLFLDYLMIYKHSYIRLYYYTVLYIRYNILYQIGSLISIDI